MNFYILFKCVVFSWKEMPMQQSCEVVSPYYYKVGIENNLKINKIYNICTYRVSYKTLYDEA